MMNICMFGASFLPRRGGMEFVIHHLANALVKEGVRVTVIAERTSWQGIGVEHDYELVRYGVPTRVLRSLGLGGPESLWAVWRQHSRMPFDILHCHSVAQAGARAVRVKRLLGIPVVMTPHGEDIQRVPEIGYGLRLDPKWDARIRKNLRYADAVTAISLSVQGELDCVEVSKVVRIPNGVHIQDYGKRESRYLRDRLGLGDDAVIVLSVGRNHVKKGYEYGIQSMAALRDKYGISHVHYAVVGKKVSKLGSLVSQLALDGTVTLIEELGPEEVRECYHSADIFFSPSIIEGLSLVSIEALACGLPLVVTDVPGNEDVVRDTGAGLVAHSMDPDHLAQALRTLVNNPGMRDAYGKAAIKKAILYDWQSVAKQYINVYEAVLDKASIASNKSRYDLG